MRILLILIFLTYTNAKFGRSYRSSDKEVLPAASVKNDSWLTDTVVVSLSPATTTTTSKHVENLTKPETKIEPPTIIETQQDYDKVIHQKTDDLKIKSLKATLEHERHAKPEEHHDKLKKASEKSGNELPDVSEEQTYDEIEEKVQKDLADQYKDEDDYSSAEQQRTSLHPASTSSTDKAIMSSSETNATGFSISNTTTPSTSTTVAITNASTSASTVAAVAASSKRSTSMKASRRNAGAIKLSVSIRTPDDAVHMTEATLGKMDISRRKTTRYPKTTTHNEFVEVEQKHDRVSDDDIAQPQKLSGLKNISDYHARRVYETTTKRVIEILRTVKYKKNASPGTIYSLERNIEKALTIFLSLSALAVSST